METPEGFELAGIIGVDAAQVLIGGACCLIESDRVPADWETWHKLLTDQGYFDGPGYKQLDMGVVVSSGRGDGEYPVYVKRAEIPDWFPGPRVQEVRIIFF